jgi:hypothetical protein
VDQMNRDGATKLRASHPQSLEEEDQRVERVYQSSLVEEWEAYADTTWRAGSDQAAFRPDLGQMMLGYVTRDGCRGRGDDIEHIPGQCGAARGGYCVG